MNDEYIIKQGIDTNQINEIIEWTYIHFKSLLSFESFKFIVCQNTNWDISVTLINNQNKIFGVYLLGDNQLPVNNICSLKYKEKKGVEGVLLAIDPTIRNMGFGNKLKDYPKTLNVDYIWGQQLKSLKNIDHWLKRRKLISVGSNSYITLEDYQCSKD